MNTTAVRTAIWEVEKCLAELETTKKVLQELIKEKRSTRRRKDLPGFDEVKGIFRKEA